jgi:acyl-CoA thioesterase-1
MKTFVYTLINYTLKLILILTIVTLILYLHEIIKHHKWQYFEDNDKANILILGDSISIGYTPFVQKELHNKANVNRPLISEFSYMPNRHLLIDGLPKNCASTKYTLKHVKKWIGDGDKKWDIIHANWGLWDAKDTSASDYETMLTELIKILKKNSNVLIIATTTPVSSENYYSSNAARKKNNKIDIFNQIVYKLSNDFELYVNDLYKDVSNNNSIYLSDGIHFTKRGYQLLGKKVSISIQKFL